MQIYIAAAVTSILTIGIWGQLLTKKNSWEERRFFLMLFLLELPMSYLALQYFRAPIDHFLRSLVDVQSYTYLWIYSTLAPLTEEPAKLLPLLIPFFYKKITRDNAVKVGLALGLGFAVSEIWTLAFLLSKSPAIVGVPWHQFGGFIGERFIVAIMHGAGTAFAVFYLVRGKFVKGLLGAMLFHYLLNLPIFLKIVHFLNLGDSTWTTVISVFLAFAFMGALALLTYLSYGNFRLGKFVMGEAKCPECGTVYDRSVFAFNLLTHRYERCPHCKKWHFTRGYHE